LDHEELTAKLERADPMDSQERKDLKDQMDPLENQDFLDP